MNTTTSPEGSDSSTTKTKAKIKLPAIPFDLVFVTWEDAHSSADWHEPSEYKKGLDIAYAHTVGWLYQQEPDRLMVMDSVIFNQDGTLHSLSGTTIIPSGMVQEIKVIKKGKGGNA